MSEKIITSKDIALVESDTSKAEKALKITKDSDLEGAAEILIHLKSQVDSAEEKRKEYVKPIQESISRINADFKTITEPRNSYITKLKEVVVSYVSAKKKALKGKEKELRKEMGDRTLVLDNGLDRVVCQYGELRFRKGYDFKVTNQNIVPTKYWILDKKAIEADIVAEGASEISIPGIKVTVNDIDSVAIYKSREE